MPIYEFYCPDNNKLYSFYARTLALGSKTPRCPDHPKYRMERAVSQFAVTGRAKEQSDLPGGGGSEIDESRMASAMAEMEREFSGMDEKNPDPRAMARALRKMSGLAGEKMPPQMEELIGRMEAGEDPEKLGEELGGALDDAGDGDGGSMEARKKLRAHLRGLAKRPNRDPQLYEMSEFVK